MPLPPPSFQRPFTDSRTVLRMSGRFAVFGVLFRSPANALSTRSPDVRRILCQFRPCTRQLSLFPPQHPAFHAIPFRSVSLAKRSRSKKQREKFALHSNASRQLTITQTLCRPMGGQRQRLLGAGGRQRGKGIHCCLDRSLSLALNRLANGSDFTFFLVLVINVTDALW